MKDDWNSKGGTRIKPRELDSDKGRDIWDTISAAAAGDTPTLRRLLDRDPSLSQADYWYTQPIHFAVRERESRTVQLTRPGTRLTPVRVMMVSPAGAGR